MTASVPPRCSGGTPCLPGRTKPALPTTDPRCRLRASAPSTLSDIAAGAPLEPDPDAVPVVVSRDYSRLKALARLWRNPDDPVGRALADKLACCRVVPRDAVPPAVAVL